MNYLDLKIQRLAAGMTQQQLAERAGLTGSNARQRIYDYEAARKGITPAMSTLFTLIFAADNQHVN